MSRYDICRVNQTLTEYNEEGNALNKTINVSMGIERHFTGKSNILIHFLANGISKFPVNIIQFKEKYDNIPLESGCFHIKEPIILAKLWALASFCLNIQTKTITKFKYQEEIKKALRMDYGAMIQAAKKYSHQAAMVLSTRTGSSSQRNGIPKVWGFTKAFLNLVNFDPKIPNNNFTLMEAIELKAKNSDLKIFPLLKRIQDGVLLDKKLASKFGVEKSLTQALKLTDELLKKCQFIDAPPTTIEDTKISSTNQELLEEIQAEEIAATRYLDELLEDDDIFEKPALFRSRNDDYIFRETIESTLHSTKNTIFTDNLNSDGESNNSTSPQSELSSPKYIPDLSTTPKYIPDEIHNVSSFTQKNSTKDQEVKSTTTPSSEQHKRANFDQSEENSLKKNNFFREIDMKEKQNKTITTKPAYIDDIPAELRNALKSFKEYSKKQQNIYEHVNEVQEHILGYSGTNTEKNTPEVLNYSNVQNQDQNNYYINPSQQSDRHNYTQIQIPTTTARYNQSYTYSGFTLPGPAAVNDIRPVETLAKRPRGRPRKNPIKQANTVSKYATAPNQNNFPLGYQNQNSMNSSQPYNMMGYYPPHPANYQPNFGYIPSHNNYTTSSQFTGNGTQVPMAAAQYQPYVNPAATGYHPSFGYFPSQNIYSTNSSQFSATTTTTTTRFQPYSTPTTAAPVYPAVNYSPGTFFNYHQNHFQ